MVRMPSGAKGVDVASLERALNCHEFESGVGEKVARAVRVLVLHPQVFQLYDELRTMVESPRLWQEVEMKFFTELIEVSHLGLDEAVEQLLRVFRLAIGDQLPGESPFFQSLGVPKVPLEPSPGVRCGPLRDTVEGIEIRELVDGWVGDDGGVYVGKGVGSWPCSPFQESYSSDLKPELVRVALNGRPLYVGRDEVGNAKEVIRRFGLSSGSCLTHLQWREGYQKLFPCPVPLSYTGVALKMGAFSRPGSLGNFLRVFRCCALRTFQGKTGELLPVRLPLETPEEIEAMELMKKVFAGRITYRSDEWSLVLKAADKAAEASWTWLQLAGMNAMYCGGGADRLLGSVLPHPPEATLAQESLLSRTKEIVSRWLKNGDELVNVADWDANSQVLEGIYTGPEVQKAYPLTLKSIIPTTPGVGEAARIELSEVVDPELAQFVLNPDLLRIREEDIVNPRTVAPVHVTDSDEWDKVVNHLVQAGMLEREVPGDTLRYKGKKVLNGAFGVHKGWAEDEKGQWFRTLRLIINLIPSNGMQRRVPHRPSQKMGYAPLWGSLALLEDEIVMCYAEDQRHCFHVYRPGRKWRGWFVLSRKASGWAFNDGHAEAALPRVMSAPMGWSNIVDFIQSGLGRMGTLAGMPANQVIKMGEPLPALPLDTPRDYFSFYVDNWDQLKVIARSSRALYEGTPSDHQLRLREVFKVWDVGRDAKKAAEGSLEWSSLGAEVDGDLGWIGSNVKFRKGVLGATLNLMLGPSRSAGSLEVQAVVSKHMHSIQFCRPLASTFDHLYREMHSAAGGMLSSLGQDELMILCMMLPQHWMMQRNQVSGQVFATDASEGGGGACVSTGLSPWGFGKIHNLTAESNGLEGGAADELVVVECFAGMGGLRQALDLLGLVPQGVVCIDNAPQSKKLSRMHCRHAIIFDDIKKVKKEDIAELRRRFPRAKKVLISGGWPCVNHSSLNIHRRGAEAATSQLLDDMLQMRAWLQEVSEPLGLPCWEVLEFYENVVMDEEDLKAQSEKIGWMPFYSDACDISRCRRPRLFWIKNIPLINAADMVRLKHATVKDLTFKLEKVSFKTERPPLDWFLEKGGVKGAGPDEPFFTFTRPIARQSPPPAPAGLDRCSEKAVRRWKGDNFRLPPYQYEESNLVKDKNGLRRLTVEEQLRLMGYPSNYLSLKNKMTNDEKGHYVGNGWHAIHVARLLVGLLTLESETSSQDLTTMLWQTWHSMETKLGCESQPWKQRFGLAFGVASGVTTLREQLSVLPSVALKELMDPLGKLSDEELLAYLFTRKATQKGSDIRVDLNMPFGLGDACRHSVDPTNWTWKVLMSYAWKQAGQHINTLETVAVLDLVRKLGRDPKQHSKKAIILVDNMVALGVLAKGRSSAKALKSPLRRLAAVMLAGNFHFWYGWVKSGWNPADGPSRWRAKL